MYLYGRLTSMAVRKKLNKVNLHGLDVFCRQQNFLNSGKKKPKSKNFSGKNALKIGKISGKLREFYLLKPV